MYIIKLYSIRFALVYSTMAKGDLSWTSGAAGAGIEAPVATSSAMVDPRGFRPGQLTYLRWYSGDKWLEMLLDNSIQMILKPQSLGKIF